MNNYQSHILVLPEDDANRSLANGFFTNHRLNISNFRIEKPLGGWSKVLDDFTDNQVRKMNKYKNRIIVMLIDFDDQHPIRIAKFHNAIPANIKDRVFVLGVLSKPEKLPTPHGKAGLEQHGLNLANDCVNNAQQYWSHLLLKHNLTELLGRDSQLKKLLF